MPLYEYQCDECGHRFEQIRKFSDPPLEICPKCGGVIRKLVSSPAFQFKGSGWYVSDYQRKGESGKSKESDGSKESKESKDSEKSSEKSKDSEKSKESTGSKESTSDSSSTSSETKKPA